MAIEDYIKFEIEKVIAELCDITKPLPTMMNGKEVVLMTVSEVLYNKVKEQLKKRIEFYDIERLLYILDRLEKANEKPQEPRLGGQPEQRNEPAVDNSAEVQPKPALESSRKQSSRKTSKGTILKRV